ncbi:hypothetical protein [Haladaptatus salinisoli]|uniref:hypothetical protein n=1 Tax=Haladaptatus salinisoli TaxID=2884876 RepID=UPI001D0B3D7E|nr:hypothetical protein [Haladaptatus salinisoli]
MGESNGLTVGDEERGGTVESAKRWFLLDGNRLTVAALGVAFFVVVVALLEVGGAVPLENRQPLFYIFSSLISGNLTLITVVVSINQLLLSRELKSPGELRSQIDSIVEYRTKVEESAGEVAPVQPLGFLKLLFQNTRQEAQRIGGLVIERESEARDEVESLVTPLTEHLDEVDKTLDDPEMTTFEVLSVTLTTNYANEINRVRRIRSAYEDDLPPHVYDALGRLVDHLQRIDIARQYFKSVYLQSELSSLSRVLFYAGIPAEAISVAALLTFTKTAGGALQPALERLLLPVVVGVGFLPLAVLFAFILRTATVTQRTTATIPFTTMEQEG